MCGVDWSNHSKPSVTRISSLKAQEESNLDLPRPRRQLLAHAGVEEHITEKDFQVIPMCWVTT